MDWITGIQRAIDYIEENITENLDYDEIAKRAYSSSYHFQRVFGILCGQTIGEYIRERRLTLAASELVSSNGKVLDVAIKYGYDSPESFGRVFTKFHGITPSQAKSCGKNLKSFSKLTRMVKALGNKPLISFLMAESIAFNSFLKASMQLKELAMETFKGS